MSRSSIRRLLIAAALVFAAGVGWWTLKKTSVAARPNLILITIDTLRADHVGAYGATTGATPRLDAFAAGGIRFDQVQTAVPLTGPSHATILTGTYPPVHGVRGNVVFTLPAKYPTLATMVKAHGYRTAAFVGAYPVAAAFGFNQGFDTFDEEFHESIPGEQGAERRANEVADAALRWLNTQGAAPFFAWLHFYDPHAPYTPPEPYRDRYRDHPYDGEIAFTDAQVGRVLDALHQSGLDSRTYVIVMADHGEGLGDHHEETHAVLIYQSTMRVPMMIAGPGIAPGRVVRERVGTIDVAPTVLSLLRIAADKSLLGEDLRPLIDGRTTTTEPLYAESLFGRLNCHWASLRGWVRGDWKLIVGHEPELYNLAEDPKEERNHATDEPDRVRKMTDDMQRALQVMAPAGDKPQVNPATAEQEERLRSLGYTAGSGGSGPIDDPSLPDPRTHVEYYDRLQAASLAAAARFGAALAEVEAITRLDPDNPFAFGTLATMAYRYGSLPLAAHAFRRALELDPERPGVRQNYGKLLREIGRAGESERELRVALEQQGGDDDRTRVSLADSLIVDRKLSEAESLLSAVLAREPTNAEAMAAKARLLMAQGRVRDALPLFEEATATSDAEPFIELASAYLDAGDLDKGTKAASEALRRASGHPWALAVMGRALALQHQAAANEYLERALALRPRRVVVWDALAAGFTAAGDPRRAAACRNEAAALATADR